MSGDLLRVAVFGDLEKYMAEELEAERRAVTEGVEETAEDMLFELRRDVVAGGLGNRLAKTWRSAHYPGRNKVSLGAASEVKTRAPKLIRAFDKGEIIKSSEGFFLAIPTDAAPKRGMGRKRITPSNFPEHSLGPLRFVYRKNGNSLLVVDNQRMTKKGKYARSRSKRALATGNGLSTVPMFTLVPQVRLKRRLNVKRITDKAPDLLERNIEKAFRRLDATRKGR
jgi:hypothetical protein